MARRKGEGSLFKRSKIWNVAVSVNGRRYDKVLGTSNRTEAEFRAKQFIQLLPSLGYESAQAKAIGFPLKDVWKKFAAKATCSPRTLSGYESNWKAFLLWAKQEGLGNTLDVKQHHVDDFLEMLGRNKHQKRLPCKETTVRTLKVVKRVFKFIGHGDIWANARVPFHCVEKPKRTGFTEEELQTIQRAFDDPKIEMYAKSEMETIHHLALHTGLRLGDCCMLKWKNIDLIHKAMNVDPLKTRRYDQHLSIPIDNELEAVLQRAKSWDDETGYVCPHLAANYQRDVPCVSADYTWLLKKAGIVTSIKKDGMKAQTLHSFHSLRHTFVSRLAEKGVSPLVIQSMSGHTTMAMTERYTHIGLDAKRRALGQEMTPEKTPQTPEESGTKKKLDAVKALLASKKDRTPLEEALLALL